MLRFLFWQWLENEITFVPCDKTKAVFQMLQIKYVGLPKSVGVFSWLQPVILPLDVTKSNTLDLKNGSSITVSI